MKTKSVINQSVWKWLLLAVLIVAVGIPFGSMKTYADGTTYRVSVASGYLALRTAKSFDRANEIGELYTGDTVEVNDTSDSTYWYVYSSKLGKSGYVNKNYLFGVSTSGSGTWTVRVSDGYLALRTAKAFDASNEIGKLYSGDTVEVNDTSDSTYWYVYSSKYGKYGYVNRNYLYGGSSSGSTVNYSGDWTVSVPDGYLALRTAKAYDATNEIGKLYTGDTVQVSDSSDSAYWYVYSPKYGKSGYVNKDFIYRNGSSSGTAAPSGASWTVSVTDGYLALRSAKAFDASNEIGKLYSGDTVQVSDSSDSTYWYVYSPKYGIYGYVNKDYIYSGSSSSTVSSGATWTVKVSESYLALRSAKAFDASNEIGKLYTGDTVQVRDTSDGTYWYVYSPKYDKYGYVNKDYLY